MFNVCPNCGEYRVDKMVLSEGPYAVCPVCEYRHKFVRLPLFVVTGASGTGKQPRASQPQPPLATLW